MSLTEEEYDGIDNGKEFESDEGEGYISQIQFLSGKKQKITYEELNVSTEPPPPLPQNYELRDSYNQMGRVICPHQLLLHRLKLDLNVDQ
ncbi:hypothetical protein GIB67_026563 [Kingdonia uniflora]|uniref:Uncharacterized protein n=1 Tax=Kingdonia uniflora TaxID=39325 RepID=A0A7J7NN75_9MAGN|nr:hypothetical protein GIB67_026563 [Kingdonia uniflora]